MNTPRRNRARVLTPDALKQLRERVRSRENEENAGFKYTLERLGELTGLDPETVKNVLDGNGSDKRTIARCFESFGLTLEDSDHIPAVQASVAAADPNFVGRDEAIADLTTLVSRKANLIVIQARGGVGKTTLARKYLQQEFGSYLEFPIAKETKDIASIEGLIEEKLRQLGEEPGREFLVSLDRLKRKLQGDRIGILIDNLEPALDSAGKFIEPHRRYVELLRVLADPTVKSLTLITTRERLREPAVTVHHYALKSLDATAWEQFFQSRSLATDTPVLADLHNAHGGNAKAMDIVSGAILEDFSGDVAAYWRVNQTDLCSERDLEDLVTQQFDRLQQLDPDAYNLLCRMGCYRYQDVPTVPIEGLFCLLWDIPENRHRRVIKSLQDRSLVDCENGEFWLHPVIRAEAIARLRSSADWEIANRKAVGIWTEISHNPETINDALSILEAYHHYIEIIDFEEASNTLTKLIKNKWGISEPFGHFCFRLGLHEKLLTAIEKIISHLENGSSLAIIYHFLGSIYRERGFPYQSIKLYESANSIASKILKDLAQPGLGKSELLTKISLKRIVQLNYFLNLSLNYTCLWRLEDALENAEEFNKLNLKLLNEMNEIYALYPNNLDFSEHLNYTKGLCVFVQIFLSYLHIHLGNKEKAFELIQEYDEKVSDAVLNSWIRGICLVLIGFVYKELGNTSKSVEKFHRSLSYAKESNYSKVEGLSLMGLAEVCRNQKEFSTALSHHLESIRILDYGAKCDLPEAYYQLGLTYQAMEETEKSDENFQEAIRLFGEMEAPKQVDRVRQSMQN